ncbi:F-box/FBD/LRR-repeat protein At1g13570-like [Lactuca sativa]|uniref:F-box/FBD/LRR-repeat protein At1g13570-like n=1 Tax=Lactuca sativa TaxID=4236 RepID=UPI0022AE6F25|nr:F-box/FBD/LRR-repeat protein At1g13570-like [Lactuca sativa]
MPVSITHYQTSHVNQSNFDLLNGTYKRRSLTCVKEDRISNLPEHLIDSILERLRIKDIVRTSIISKKWRYTWTKIKVLVLDEQFSIKFAQNGAFDRNGFINTINHVLTSHNCPILKFHLHIPNMFLDSYQEVDQWMLLLSRKSVRELVLITTSNRRDEHPSNVFSCLKLTKLDLKNCFIKQPLELERFINLQTLFLLNIVFGANFCETEINLPKLKTLSLSNCTHVYSFNIKDFVRAERLTLATMLSNLPKVRSLVTDGHFLKFLSAEKNLNWLPHAVNGLHNLLLMDFELGDLDQLHGALYLLRNSPNLGDLGIVPWYMGPQVDAAPALNHLESLNCLDYTLNELQTVMIVSLEGSRPELLFIKLLLAHSPSLKKFTFRLNEVDVQKRLKIGEDILQFPRASPKAELVLPLEVRGTPLLKQSVSAKGFVKKIELVICLNT